MHYHPARHRADGAEHASDMDREYRVPRIVLIEAPQSDEVLSTSALATSLYEDLEGGHHVTGR